MKNEGTDEQCVAVCFVLNNTTTIKLCTIFQFPKSISC